MSVKQNANLGYVIRLGWDVLVFGLGSWVGLGGSIYFSYQPVIRSTSLKFSILFLNTVKI